MTTVPCAILSAVSTESAKRGLVVSLDNFPIDTQPNKPFAPGFIDDVLMFPLLAADKRRHDDQAGAFFERQHRVDNLFNGLLADRLAALHTVWNTNAGEQEAEVVVDFRDSTNSRAGVFRGSLLFY
jgi:hypothetical protein